MAAGRPEGFENGVALLASLDESVALEIIRAFLVERPALLQALCDWAVPEHAFPSSKIVEARQHGHVKSFNMETGYGFISSPELMNAFGKDIFLSSHQIEGRGHSFDSFRAGQGVSFSIFLNKGKLQAYDLSPDISAKPRVGKGLTPGFGKGHWDVGYDSKGGHHVAVSSGHSKGSWDAGYDSKGCGKAAWGAGYGAPLIGPDQFVGQVKSYNAEKKFGFLICEDVQRLIGKSEIFVHSSQLEHINGFGPGQLYSFTLAQDPQGKPMAANLRWEWPAGQYQPMQKMVAVPSRPPSMPPEVSYSAHPVLTGTRFVAPVKSYNPLKGFGFLFCEELASTFGKADIFVHHSQVNLVKDLQAFREGATFSFTVVVDAHGKPMAIELMPDSANNVKRQPVGIELMPDIANNVKRQRVTY